MSLATTRRFLPPRQTILQMIMQQHGLSNETLAQAMQLPNPDNIRAILDGTLPVDETGLNALIEALRLSLPEELALKTVYGCAIRDQKSKVGDCQALAVLLAYLDCDSIPESMREDTLRMLNAIAQGILDELAGEIPHI